MPESVGRALERPEIIAIKPEVTELVLHEREVGRTTKKLRLFWERRRLIVRCAIAALAIALGMAFLIPARYESSTLLMPPDQQSESSMAMLAALSRAGGGGLGADLLGLKTSGDLFIGVLRSRTVGDAIISKFDLRKVYGDRRWEDARLDLAKRTEVFNDRKNGIISITTTDGSPQRAAAIAAEYVTQLNSVMTHLNTSAAHRERMFLEARLGEVQNDLENAEKDFSVFASKNTAMDVQSQGRAMIEAIASLGGQVIATETELKGLRQIYSENNVRVRTTQARLNELRNQEQNLTGEESKSGKAAASSSSAFPSLRKLPLLGVEYSDLSRRVKVQQAIFETLTQEYELAKVQEAKELPSVKVLDSPNIPERKSFPPRLRIAFMGMFCGAFAAMVWIAAENRWQAVDAQEPGKVLAQEVFATLRARIPLNARNGSHGGEQIVGRGASQE